MTNHEGHEDRLGHIAQALTHRRAQALTHLHRRARVLRLRMQGLEIQDVAHATIYFGLDRGGHKTIMKLGHRPDSPSAPGTVRRREYIPTTNTTHRWLG